MAKVSCILVSTWLTIPYFFVVSMGALQSIPEELTEAARVDGGNPFQIFRRVTLPLLLVAVGPLLIASFAFNFNNFNNIYLLTGGGPTVANSNIAGATDILISYTYKVAFIQGKGNNYGLAAAIHDRRLPDHGRDLRVRVLENRSPGGSRMSTVDIAATADADRCRSESSAEAAEARRDVVAPHRRDRRLHRRALPDLVRRLGRVRQQPVDLGHRASRRRTGRSTTSADSCTTTIPSAGGQRHGLRAVPPLVRQHDDHRDHQRALHRDHLGVGRVRLQPLPLQGPPDGDARAAPDPDVPDACSSSSRSTSSILNVGGIYPAISLNSYAALILVYLGGALGVNTWLMKGFFDTIPKELDESARVDGATPAQIFWGVVLPLALPILAVIGLWSFIASLNEYVLASVIMQTPDHYTLPVGLRGFINGNYSTYWGYFAAAALMAAIPAVALFAWLQRYIVSGLAQGAVKG